MKKINHLYIHIPFCDSICGYCDFTRVKYNNKLVDDYLEHLEKELNSHKLKKEVLTIYVGGGTPSSLNVNQLKRFLKILKDFSFDEFTFEANPESLTLEKIKILNEFGVNRVSLGVQTFNDKLLKIMNRHHTTKETIQVINNLKNNGISNISIDLMYSLPNSTIDDLKSDLINFINLDIDHLSIYSLTIEPNSEFKKLNISNLDSEIEANMYFEIASFLDKKGFKHYEISAFARNNRYSKHNLAYWNYNEFLGIGLGASSKYNSKRIDNTRNFTSYLNDNYVNEVVDLSKEDLMFENIMMSLRTMWGLDLEEFENRYQKSIFDTYLEALEKHLNKNLEIKKNHLKCKEGSLALLNDILLDFLN